MKQLRLFTLCSFLLVCLHAFPNPAPAYHRQHESVTLDATDNAFAALLSMPSAKPKDGYWYFPPANDFEVGTESHLIIYLTKQKKMGADFSAYRHYGTLLHHAIRAGLTRTAIWLMKHGADPHQKLIERPDADAYTVSVEHKRVPITQVLERSYGFIPYARRHKTTKQANKSNIGSQYKDQKSLAEIDDHDEAMAHLIRTNLPLNTDLDRVLSAIPSDVRARHATAVFAAVTQANNVDFRASDSSRPKYWITKEAWRTLWRFFPSPITYAKNRPIAMMVQAELWPELFASGYQEKNSENALGCMLAEIGFEDFKAVWPIIEHHFTDIRQTAPRLILRPYRIGRQSDCYAADEKETVQKLSWLRSIGISQIVTGISERELEYRSEDLKREIRFFQPTPLGAKLKSPRFIVQNASCRFKLTDKWFEFIQKNSILGNALDQPVNLDVVQLVELPNESECALLVSGYTRHEEYRSGIIDTFTGSIQEPYPSCPDPVDFSEIWQMKNGEIIKLPANYGQDWGSPNLILVRDTLKNELHYLHTGQKLGRCSFTRLPYLLSWNTPNDKLELNKNTSLENENALYDQCVEETDVVCQGIGQMRELSEYAYTRREPSTPNLSDAYLGLELNDFIKTLWADDYHAYQAAILTFDLEKLKAFRKKRVPGLWSADAIKNVGKSDIDLIEKRRRIGWIFSDQAQLIEALKHDFLESLIDWLPREDWHPIFKAIQKHPFRYYGLSYLRDSAAERRLIGLRCDLDHAQFLICGGSFAEEKPSN